MIIDLHCHYTFTQRREPAAVRFDFEPLADPAGGLPTAYDSCVSPRALRRPTWRLARWAVGLPADAAELDARLEHDYARHLFAPGPIERYVLLAFDAVHDDAGRPRPLPLRRGDFGSDIYTSNTLARWARDQHPERFLFGASVHPYRPNAEHCLRAVAAAGACLLKWLPQHHNINVQDPRTIAVLRLCAELRLPLLVHYGDEFSLTMHRREYRSVRPLLDVLRELRRAGQMPTVIAAHAATPALPWGDHDSHRALLAALAGEFADAPLFADISALIAWTKVPFLRRLLRRRELHPKLLFGTDFPVPTGLLRVRGDLGRAYRSLKAVQSWPQRAALAVRALGFEEIVFQRAAELLPNVGAHAGTSADARPNVGADARPNVGAGPSAGAGSGPGVTGRR